METKAVGYRDEGAEAETWIDGRDRDFAALYRELIEEAGRALEEGEEAWCALLQEVLIPSVEPRGLRALAAIGRVGAAAPYASRTA